MLSLQISHKQRDRSLTTSNLHFTELFRSRRFYKRD